MSKASPAPPPPQGGPISARAADALSEADRRALAQAGGPADERSSYAAGATKGVLSRLAGLLADHPGAIRAIFNNPLVVKGFMSRERVQRDCRSEAGLVNWLTDTRDPKGVSAMTSAASQIMSNRQTAQAFMGSEFAVQVFSCPSMSALSRDGDMRPGSFPAHGREC